MAQVKVCTVEDESQDKHLYDTDMYQGQPLEEYNIREDATEDDTQDDCPNTEQYSANDIIAYINTISTTINTTVFTAKQLQDHINNHRKLNMQVQLQQMDSGANRNVTNDKGLLQQYRNISKIPVYGVGKEAAACYLIGKGFLHLQATNGEWVKIEMYYSPGCSGTILSPNAIAKEHPAFSGWTQTSDMDTHKATISFFNKNAFYRNVSFEMRGKNDLWYIQQPYLSTLQKSRRHKYVVQDNPIPTINKLQKAMEHELWHQRLLHPGEVTMKYIHHCVEGVPKMHKHPMQKCRVCDEMKITKASKRGGTSKDTTKPGERFHMDFGFVRGKKNNISVRSHDGYRAYLLIVDHFTRYGWVFLSKNKNPPIATVRYFLNSYGLKDNAVKIVRTDQGGELANCEAFRKTIEEASYTLEITGSDNSSQNGIAERPHKTLADMMRASLENSGLGPEYWSDALIHSMFVKNRLPHQAFDHKFTPYERLCGVKPNLSNLRVFGSRVVTKRTGKRPAKLSKHSFNGIFLRYAKTMRNIVYMDTTTRKIKTATHALFDEGHYSYSNRPPGGQRLFDMGLKEMSSVKENAPTNAMDLKVVKTNPMATIPTRATDLSAGYDLYSTQEYKIPPNSIAIIDTGIRIQLPSGTYGRIASRSGLVVKHCIETKAGVIDPDYTGVIKVVLHNFGNTEYTINPQDRVAQLILERHLTAPTTIAKSIHDTARGENGFGSTDGIPAADTKIKVTQLQAADIELCWNEPIFTTLINLPNKGPHSMRGLVLREHQQQIHITDCLKGTQAAKIYDWRRTLRGTRLLQMNGTNVTSILQCKQIIDATPRSENITLTIASKFPLSINPESGIPQMSFDQFNVVAKHHQSILEAKHEYVNIDEAPSLNNSVINSTNGKPTPKMTRRYLQKQEDWSDWEASEFLQLDQYEKQNMFSDPGPLPSMTDETINVLPMIWTYLIKVCGRKKARCVANGAPHLQGSITLAHTYAACLEQSGCRLFWAIAALKNKIVYGSDASNAFAEAPAPKAPLYLKVDEAYRNWYQHKTGIVLPVDSYVKVKHAIQGHPESPRLWQNHINQILYDIGFKPTHHERCIYRIDKEIFGEEIYLLRQVDDFAVACDTEAVAEKIWDLIDSKLSEKLKREGILERHNGIDIVQSQDFVQITCETYLNKILSGKPFEYDTTVDTPVPMLEKHIKMMDQTLGPEDPNEQKALEREMGFKYRACTGEFIFAMTTCRPDISFAVLKLTQYNHRPSKCHYEAIGQIYKYLNATKSEGITYWRPDKNKDLPYRPLPIVSPEQYDVKISEEHHNQEQVYGMVDSDWAGDIKTRKSVSGVVLMLAGAAVIYKTILQRTIAMSSTEAEFYALADAGKLTLYLRSVMSDLNIEQYHATPMYEDNQGCRLMASASKPTRRTRHIDIKYFAILDWVNRDLINIKGINTSDNAADNLTKANSKTLFYRHADTIMGKRVPTYAQGNQSSDENNGSDIARVLQLL